MILMANKESFGKRIKTYLKDPNKESLLRADLLYASEIKNLEEKRAGYVPVFVARSLIKPRMIL